MSIGNHVGQARQESWGDDGVERVECDEDLHPSEPN